MICGLVIFFTEIFGVFHFQYVLNRMHATAMGDTLGIASCLIGLIIFSGFNFTSLKMLLIIIFLWFASPVSSHVLARLEVATNDNLEAHCKVYTDLHCLEEELAQADALSTEASAHHAPQTETTQSGRTGGEIS